MLKKGAKGPAREQGRDEPWFLAIAGHLIAGLSTKNDLNRSVVDREMREMWYGQAFPRKSCEWTARRVADFVRGWRWSILVYGAVNKQDENNDLWLLRPLPTLTAIIILSVLSVL